MTFYRRDLLVYGAGVLGAAMFPAARWCPLRVTPALGLGAALLLVLAGALALRRWWRKWLRVDELIREDAEPLPWRLPVTPAELDALNGEADLRAVVDATPLKHMEAL